MVQGGVAYSKNGNVIHSVQHVIDELKLPDDICIDGVLYIHNTPLQQLSSLVRRSQPGSSSLIYVVYDVVKPESYEIRHEFLHMTIKNHSNIQLIPTSELETIDEESLFNYRDSYIRMGYEGAMLRLNDFNYESGKRSKSLWKLKTYDDDEFIVREISASEDSRGAWAVLHCDGFTVSAPGTIKEKQHTLRHKELYVGKKVTVKYFGKTSNNVPFHPVALHWRLDD
jgi:DNA ligase-1